MTGKPTELSVEKLLPGGPGLARLNGEAILLPEVLPGERVLAEIGQRRGGVRRGRVLEILSASPWRVEPDCPHFGHCGGCDFLHVAPRAALALKSEAALGDLAAAWGLSPELVESPLRTNYRSRAVLHLGPGADGRRAIGFYDRQRSVVDFAECRLLSPELMKALPPLKEWAAKAPPGAPEIEINLMMGADARGLMIILSPAPARGRDKRSAGRTTEAPDPAGLISNLEKLAVADLAVFWRPSERVQPKRLSSGGPRRLTAAVWPCWGLTLRSAPGGFSQVNPPVNMAMVEKALALAAPLAPGPALDLYSGLGNFALPLLKSGFRVTAVEEAPEGAAAARENGRGLSGFRLIQGRSGEVAAGLAKKGERFKLLLLDPPRAGARDLAPTLAALNPERIIYVACHPAVLGRDIPAFISLGYRPDRLLALDMFPRTSHLEALVSLARG
ncbi:MAG: hypothetical protein LBP33_12990 [Candidatus Adiutrix sp.]|jgi:23S rRNA (uracil1939-C5)-methyltransferase|nr:hypothetical protein [Candidatus Adiutrix sp.]